MKRQRRGRGGASKIIGGKDSFRGAEITNGMKNMGKEKGKAVLKMAGRRKDEKRLGGGET